MKDGGGRKPWDIVLVGRRLADNENLGIGYLLASAKAAGLRARWIALNSWPELESASAQICELRPALVGLSLSDGGSAILPLSLGQLLAARAGDPSSYSSTTRVARSPYGRRGPLEPCRPRPTRAS